MNLRMRTAEEIYSTAAGAGARPDPKLPISEWADQYRILTTRSSPEPGLWRTSRTPFLKDIMDSLMADSPWEKVVFMKGSQIGATECGNNWIGYVIHLSPGPMLVVQPTETMAKRNSKQRIGPLIEESPVLRNLVRPARERDRVRIESRRHWFLAAKHPRHAPHFQPPRSLPSPCPHLLSTKR